MLKLVIICVIFATASAAPHQPTTADNSGDDRTHFQTLLLRPSPINPDVKSDPKPEEKIILDDTKPERDQRSLSDKDKSSAHGHESHEHESYERDAHGHDSHEDFKNVRENINDHSDHKQDSHEDHSDHKQDSHEEHHNENSNDHHENGHHDHKRESDVSEVPATVDFKPKELIRPKESLQPITSGEPTIVFAKKEDEKRSATDSFETSHRIPHIDESERTFETSHHIPSHIEDERTKSIENAKLGQKSAE